MEEQKQTPKTTSRRSFLGASLTIVLLAAMAGVINTLVKYLWPTKEIIGAGAAGGTTTVPLSEVPIGGSKTVRYLGKPYVVVRLATGIYAVSAVCTHLGCIVDWDEARKILACPCHAGFFSLNGSVISGPPPAPLPVAQVKVVGNQIILS
jgi:cytochrome b6-f complex iron-sulfur subunit